MNMSDQFVLEFTTNQQNEIVQKCGFNPKAVYTSVLSLIKFSLAACASESESLPIAKNISTIDPLFNQHNKSDNIFEPYSIVLKLTEEQRSIIKTIVNKDWNSIIFYPDEHLNSFVEKWETEVSAINIGKSIVILPENFDYSPLPNEILIRIPYSKNDTSDTFGKGNHGTTQSVLVLMEKYFKNGGVTLDVGTGSGILAIASAKLGANSITAIDIDSTAIIDAKKTIKINNLEEKIKVSEGTIESINGVFDLVLANLFPNIIITLAKDLSQKVKPGGLLIVSGIVEPRMPGVIEHLEKHGCVFLDHAIVRGWVAIIFKKHS